MNEHTSPLPGARRRSARRKVWVLRRWDQHNDDIELHADEAGALAWLAADVRTSWTNITGEEQVPPEPPADDRAAVELYFAHRKHLGEGYSLCETPVRERPVTPLVPGSFPDHQRCEQLNQAAVFHPQTTEDDLPCVEMGNVLVFIYLDADRQALRLSVDQDTAPAELLRSDGLLPFRLELGDGSCFSLPYKSAPA
ncbi:hypothetical protein [Streptomyces venezuelae]|uniref:hypothetical protein n=1 Tax=Streptomyces venezuelae TaxID=54571 RepID=UPI003443EA91